MATAFLVTLAAALVVLGAIAGSAQAKVSVGRVFVAALPVFVVGGAAILPSGIVWWSALLLAVVVGVGILLAVPLAARCAPDTAVAGSRWGLAATIAAMQSAVAVILGAVALRWLVPVIQSVTPLDGPALAVVLVSAGVAAAAIGGGRLGAARAALVIGVVVAVLAAGVGVALGTPAQTMSPVVPVAGPGAAVLVISAIAVLLIASAHPGLAELSRERPVAVRRGALVTAVVGFAAVMGMAWFAGASLQFPSMPLSVIAGYVAFAPPVVGGFVAALAAIVATVLVASALEAALSPWEGFGDSAPGGWLSHRWVAVVVAGVGVMLMALTPLSGAWMLGVAAMAAFIMWIAATLSRRGAAQPQTSG
mgnify:FL=1